MTNILNGSHIPKIVSNYVLIWKLCSCAQRGYTKIYEIDVVEAWRKHTQYSLDGTKTKLLISGNKPRIHERFS